MSDMAHARGTPLHAESLGKVAMERSLTSDGYTSEDDRTFLEEFDTFGACDGCGGPDTGYCFCTVSESSADLARVRLTYAHDVTQAQRRVCQRAARNHLWKFRIGVKVMIIANYWFFLPLRPGARGVDRAEKRFGAACVGSAE